jgi:hypothetical protein
MESRAGCPLLETANIRSGCGECAIRDLQLPAETFEELLLTVMKEQQVL